MKRFLLFYGTNYYPYPDGGMGDFQDSYSTLDDAISDGEANGDWWNVLDIETRKVYGVWEDYTGEKAVKLDG